MVKVILLLLDGPHLSFNELCPSPLNIHCLGLILLMLSETLVSPLIF